ncbi:MAG: hypothetical protein IPG93_22670 [Burkholderiales bacterium]|nr:hypothetical protein [Burkholderiales bacterium]
MGRRLPSKAPCRQGDLDPATGLWLTDPGSLHDESAELAAEGGFDAFKLRLGLYWFEEPTTYNNLEGYAQLARELRTPLQLGENFYGPRELYRAVAMQAGDDVMSDMMRIGGVSGWLRSAPIAAPAGQLQIPDRAGIGIEWDEDAVRRFAF